MTAFIPFRFNYGPPENGPYTGYKDNQLKKILETVVEYSKAALQKWDAKMRYKAFTNQIYGAQPQDHKAPKNHDMEDTGPEITGLSFLDKAVDNEVEKSLAKGRKAWIPLP